MIDFSLVKLFLFIVYIVRISSSEETKITKCLKSPDTWKKVDKAIMECQEDVKLNIINDAFHAINNGWDDSFFDHDEHVSWDLNQSEHGQEPPNYDHHSQIQDHHPSIADHRPSIHDHHFSRPEYHSSIPDHQSSMPDHHSSIPDHHSSIPDHHSSIPNHHSSIQDHHSSIPKHHSSIQDHHSSIREHHSSISDHQSSRPEEHYPTHDHYSSIQDHPSTFQDYQSSIHDHQPSINDHHSGVFEHTDHQSSQRHPSHGHSSIHSIHYENPTHLPFPHGPPEQHHHERQIEMPQLKISQHSARQKPLRAIHSRIEHKHTDSLSENPVEHSQHIDMNDFRKKRDASDHHAWIHPSTVTYHDKRIAGCIMQCIYKKNHAVDQLGWPTLDGLVNFYSEGVNEHGYFMATLRAVDYCLKGSSAKYHVNRRSTPEKGQTCDVAFDVFDCISDRITEYCSDDHHPDSSHKL